MALTYQQIVTLACQIAKTPGMTSQAGQLLTSVLDELSQTYDFDLARGTFYFNFQPGLISTDPNVIAGGGPYPLPADYLRADLDDVFWTLLGVPYTMINISLAQFDATVQQSGISNYPYWYATDMSQTPPVMYVYPPPSGAYPVTIRYRRQMPDIATPETSTEVPWFPNTNYLTTRLAGELMKIADDDRAQVFLGEGPAGAQGILDRYLKMKDDQGARAQTVSLDRQRFSRGFKNLPNTKTIGW